MPVKMIAVGRYYDTHTGKEYKHGAEFHVANDKDADRLERIRKAKRAHPHVVAPDAPAKPQIKSRVMTPEPTLEPVVAPPEPYVDPEFSNPAPVAEPEPVVTIPTSRLGRYRRNDMRSED